MFKFGFSEEDAADAENTLNIDEVVWLESKEIIPHDTIIPKIYDCSQYSIFKCKNNVDIKHLSTDNIIKYMKKNNNHNSIALAEEKQSDLVTGVYEGGLKIWECTKDLLDFICSEQIDLNTKNVLDLGCGAGIIGIYSLLNGAQLYFQDYNPDVITYVTVPNVLLNLSDKGTISNTSKFYSGDWQSFSDILKANNARFDFIFTSETVYNINNYRKLHSVFVNCLKKTGIVYLAAKTYYFGVGGGLRSFEDFVRNMGILDYQRSWMCANGFECCSSSNAAFVRNNAYLSVIRTNVWRRAYHRSHLGVFQYTPQFLPETVKMLVYLQYNLQFLLGDILNLMCFSTITEY